MPDDLNKPDDSQKSPRLLAKLALALVATATTMVLTELAFFYAGPHFQVMGKPYFRDAAGNSVAKLYQITNFLNSGWERTPPATQILPGFQFGMCYDKPEHDYFDDEGCVECVINNWGFRDDDFPLQKPDGELRIIAGGDSFTFGLGVAQNSTWPQVLEQELGDHESRPVQVMNAGFSWGPSPRFYSDWFINDALAFEPDAVIIGLCLNDMHGSIAMIGRRVAKLRPYAGGTRWTPFLRLRQFLDQRDLDALRIKNYADIVRHDPEAWENNKAALLRMKAVFDSAGVRYVIAILPMLSMLDDEYPYRELHQIVEEFCEAHGIECVDLLPRFLDHYDRELWVHATDQHPNAKGQRMIAEGIFEYWRSSAGE